MTFFLKYSYMCLTFDPICHTEVTPASPMNIHRHVKKILLWCIGDDSPAV